jgi:hypothetical protein
MLAPVVRSGAVRVWRQSGVRRLVILLMRLTRIWFQPPWRCFVTIYFTKRFYKPCSFKTICKDNVAINRINAPHKRINSRQHFTGHTTPVWTYFSKFSSSVYSSIYCTPSAENKLNFSVAHTTNTFLGADGNVKITVTDLRVGLLDTSIQWTLQSCFVFVLKRSACPEICLDCNRIIVQQSENRLLGS